MTDVESMKKIVRSTYAARVKGDLEGTLAAFADDIVFEFNGRGTGVPSMGAPVHGIEALRPVMKELVDNFRFSDWREVSLIAEGEKAAPSIGAREDYRSVERKIRRFRRVRFYNFS